MAKPKSLLEAAPRPNLPTRFVMLIGGLMITVSLSALTPVLAHIETALAVTEDEQLMVKMLGPIAGAAMVFGAPLAGYLIDRFPLRPILLALSLMFSLGGVAGLFVENLAVLLSLRLAVGIGAAGMATIAMALISKLPDPVERARWMGFHIASAMLGALIIHPLAGLLGQIGWQWPFLIHAIGFTVTIAALLGAKLTGTATQARADAGASPEERNPLKWFPLWYVPLGLLMGSVTYLPSVYLPFLARDVGVENPMTISLIMLADVIIGACMSLIFGWSQRYISSNTAFIFTFACVGTGMLVVSLSTNFVGLAMGMLIFGFGIGWKVPNLMTSLSKLVTETQQGRAVGIVKSAHYLGSPFAVLVVEPVVRAFGPTGATMMSSGTAFFLVAVFAYIAVGRRVPYKKRAASHI